MKFISSAKLVVMISLALHVPGWVPVHAQSLKVPYVSLSPTAGPLWIAHEAGYFKKNNLNVELLIFRADR